MGRPAISEHETEAMTIKDRNGTSLTVPEDCDRDYLRWLVQQGIDRSGLLKQEVAAANDLQPAHVSAALGPGGQAWDYARVRIVEWAFSATVECILTTSKWSDGRKLKKETFRLHPRG